MKTIVTPKVMKVFPIVLAMVLCAAFSLSAFADSNNDVMLLAGDQPDIYGGDGQPSGSDSSGDYGPESSDLAGFIPVRVANSDIQFFEVHFSTDDPIFITSASEKELIYHLRIIPDNHVFGSGTVSGSLDLVFVPSFLGLSGQVYLPTGSVVSTTYTWMDDDNGKDVTSMKTSVSSSMSSSLSVHFSTESSGVSITSFSYVTSPKLTFPGTIRDVPYFSLSLLFDEAPISVFSDLDIHLRYLSISSTSASAAQKSGKSLYPKFTVFQLQSLGDFYLSDNLVPREPSDPSDPDQPGSGSSFDDSNILNGIAGLGDKIDNLTGAIVGTPGQFDDLNNSLNNQDQLEQDFFNRADPDSFRDYANQVNDNLLHSLDKSDSSSPMGLLWQMTNHWLSSLGELFYFDGFFGILGKLL